MDEQRQDAETYDQKQDGYGAVQEESIRQDGDDRVFCRVKKPVIIPKENMMEGHEKIVPVQGNEKAKNGRKQGREDARQL